MGDTELLNSAASRTTFHPLPIAQRIEETRDALSLTLRIAPALRDLFRFSAGQYLTLQSTIAGEPVRRSYSICSTPLEFEQLSTIRVAIKRVDGGTYSSYAHEHLREGDTILVMPPAGRFLFGTSQLVEAPMHYVAFAAGSGITPILSIMETALSTQHNCRFTLIYGNRSAESILFLEALAGLKNKFIERVRLIHILSRQPQETSLLNGRIDADKVKQLLASLVPINTIDQAFICGPHSMIDAVQGALVFAGMNKANIQSERFGTPTAIAPAKVSKLSTAVGRQASLQIILDGSTRTMPFAFDGPKLLDVALAAGLDLPYACKGGVCCTCRARVMAGEVKMEKNYTLEDWEIKKGYVLTCQCLPVSETVVVSFDER